MKRYGIFVFESYYPKGGLEDLCGSVDEKPTLECLIAILRKIRLERSFEDEGWVQVFDFDKRELVLFMRYEDQYLNGMVFSKVNGSELGEEIRIEPSK